MGGYESDAWCALGGTLSHLPLLLDVLMVLDTNDVAGHGIGKAGLSRFIEAVIGMANHTQKLPQSIIGAYSRFCDFGFRFMLLLLEHLYLLVDGRLVLILTRPFLDLTFPIGKTLRLFGDLAKWTVPHYLTRFRGVCGCHEATTDA